MEKNAATPSKPRKTESQQREKVAEEVEEDLKKTVSQIKKHLKGLSLTELGIFLDYEKKGKNKIN